MIATDERRFARIWRAFRPLLDRAYAWSNGGRNRRSRASATAAVVIAHAVLLTLALGATQGRTFSTGEGASAGDAEGLRVSLQGLDGLPTQFYRRKAWKPSNAAELEALALRLNADSPKAVDAVTERHPSSSPDLMDLFEPERPSAQPSGPGKGPQGDGGRGGASGATTGESIGQPNATEGVSGGAPLASGALWNQVVKCWRPERSSVPVVLVVTLDGVGRIAAPPRIVRPTGAELNEQRLISETRAIQAVASCAPFRGVAGRRAVRFEFVATSTH